MTPLTLPTAFVEAYPDALCLALSQTEPITSLRLNARKPYNHQYTDRVEWWDEGYYLDKRPLFTLDPVFATGAYYVQEASSMFVGWLVERLELPDNPKVLDLCAAPGGKSTLLSSIIGNQGVLVANETIRLRSSTLAQNVQKWGDGNTIVTSADATTFGNMGAMFDLILVDAPCSGEGMFRKEPISIEQWSQGNVAKCASRARRIVGDVWDALHEGGYLIYSTCTFNHFENQDNVQWIVNQLGGQIVNINHTIDGIVANDDGGYNFYPHLVRGEGFYACVIRKTAMAQTKVPKNERKVKNTSKISSQYTKEPMLYVEQSGSLYGYSTQLSAMVDRLRLSRVFMLYAGVELGVEFRGQLRPSHPLALSPLMQSGLWPSVELDLDTAIEYMRKNAINPFLLKQGLNVIKYNGLALGFAKRIGSRVNNLYPTSWRIATL